MSASWLSGLEQQNPVNITLPSHKILLDEELNVSICNPKIQLPTNDREITPQVDSPILNGVVVLPSTKLEISFSYTIGPSPQRVPFFLYDYLFQVQLYLSCGNLWSYGMVNRCPGDNIGRQEFNSTFKNEFFAPSKDGTYHLTVSMSTATNFKNVLSRESKSCNIAFIKVCFNIHSSL